MDELEASGTVLNRQELTTLICDTSLKYEICLDISRPSLNS
jgi:hypothetical protein